MKNRCYLSGVAGCVLMVAWGVTMASSLPSERPDPYQDPEGYLEQQLRCTDLAVLGTVIAINDSVVAGSIDSRTGKPSGFLVTFVTIEVSTVLNGAYTERTLEFWHLGGTRGGLSMGSSVQTEFTLGSQVLLFLREGQLTEPLVDNLESPKYALGGRRDHYVVKAGSVYHARGPHTPGGSDAMSQYSAPVFALDSLIDKVETYLRSVSVDSLAVKASTIMVGEISSNRSVHDSEEAEYSSIVLNGGQVIKGSNVRFPVEIICDKDVGRYGCELDRPTFPVGKRVVVFLIGPVEGLYRLAGGWASARVFSRDTDEQEMIDKITVVLGK